MTSLLIFRQKCQILSCVDINRAWRGVTPPTPPVGTGLLEIILRTNHFKFLHGSNRPIAPPHNQNRGDFQRSQHHGTIQEIFAVVTCKKSNEDELKIVLCQLIEYTVLRATTLFSYGKLTVALQLYTDRIYTNPYFVIYGLV